MAKLIVRILSSLDGYCAGPGGTLAGLPMDTAFGIHNLDCMRRAGTLPLGPPLPDVRGLLAQLRPRPRQ